MIKDMIMRMAENDPRYAQAVDAMEAQVARMPIVPEDLDEAIQLLEFVLQNPDKYQEVRKAAIEDGVIDAQIVPEQYDQVFVVSLLVALYGLQDRLKQRGYARGGLATAARRVAAAGRGGDTQLAHINSREAEMLKRMGGAGTINPNTGLHEYKGGLGKFLGAVAPIALSFIAPGLGTAIGTALGASGIGASMLGGAIIGAASSGLTGGDWKQGALMGGLGGGLGGAVGSATNSALGLGLGSTGQAILGSGLVGAGAGALTGQGVMKGALQGVAGGAIGELAGGLSSGPTAFEQGVQAAGRTFGQGLTAGYDPKTAAAAGALSGLATGMTYKPTTSSNIGLKPSDSVVEGLKVGSSTPQDLNLGEYKMNYLTGKMEYVPGSGAGVDYSLTAGMKPSGMVQQADGSYVNQGAINTAADKAMTDFTKTAFPTGTGATTPAGTGTGILGSNISAGQALAGLGLLSALSSAPKPVQQAVQEMSPEQQEYFNRPSISWDWDKLQNDANTNNLSLTEYMARYWPKITSGAYNTPIATTNKARGGALSAVARFAQGAGSGRADTIDAKLSDGEYVMDAETVAMLGDGSNKEGAKRLDAMRQNIRSHKGKVLAKGKFSPNAKSPLAYLKGVA